MGKKMTFPELAARIKQKSNVTDVHNDESHRPRAAPLAGDALRNRKVPRQWIQKWILDVPIREVINRQVHTVQEQVSFESAGECMVENRLHGLIVVDEDGHMKGYLPAIDALEFYTDHGDAAERSSPTVKLRRGGAYSLGGGFHLEELEQVTVSELMYPVTFVLRADEPLGWGIELLLVSGLPELAVLSSQNEILGTLSFVEIGAWLVNPQPRPHAALAQTEIRRVTEIPVRVPQRALAKKPPPRSHRIIA